MSDMAEMQRLIEEQGRTWEEFRKTNDEAIKAKADSKSVADLEVKLANANKGLDQIDEIKTRLAEAEKRANRPQGDQKGADLALEVKTFNAQRQSWSTNPVAPIAEDAYVAYKNAFMKTVRSGERMLSAEEQKAMQAGVDTDGGFLVPAPTVGRIMSRIYELSPIRQIVNVIPISTPALEGIEDLGEGAAGWTTETGTRSDSTTPSVGKYRIEAFEMYAMPKATQTLLDDAAVDIEGWLAMKTASKMARVEADAFLNGNGVGKPRGLTTYTTAATADASRSWGQFEHAATATSSDFAASNPSDILFDLISKFKAAYLQRASWLTRREVIAKVRKFKGATTGDYLWQPGLQAGQPDRLLGYPIVISQDMPTLANGSLSMALGDFQQAYTVVDRIGMRTLRDPFTDKPYVKFYTTRRVGGGAVDFEACKFVKFGS